MFVGLERIGGWMCWDISDPTAPVFQVKRTNAVLWPLSVEKLFSFSFVQAWFVGDIAFLRLLSSPLFPRHDELNRWLQAHACDIVVVQKIGTGSSPFLFRKRLPLFSIFSSPSCLSFSLFFFVPHPYPSSLRIFLYT